VRLVAGEVAAVAIAPVYSLDVSVGRDRQPQRPVESARTRDRKTGTRVGRSRHCILNRRDPVAECVRDVQRAVAMQTHPSRTDCAACGTKQKAPGLRQGLMLKQQGSAYRLTWRLVPPPGAPVPLSPLETTLTQSSPLSLK
jgi:hypothetical protein